MTQSQSPREQAQTAYNDLLEDLAADARSRDGSLPKSVNEAMADALHTSPDPERDAALLRYAHSDPDKKEARRHYIDSNNPTDDERRFGWARTAVFSDVADRY
jgi:hypothetical protein